MWPLKRKAKQPELQRQTPVLQVPKAPAPQVDVPKPELKQVIAENDPRTDAHIQLRTLKKQGPSFGNVAPLGAIDGDTSRVLFEQKPTKSLTKRDPAPSRARYKIERLWLTPFVRRAVLKGVPMLLLALVALIFLSDDERQARIAKVLTDTREQIQSHPEFRVELMKVTGANSDLAEDIRRVAGVTLPMTSFNLDLEAVRGRIELLDEVEAASLFLRTGGVLEVAVTPRKPVVLWRTAKGLQLLDYNGVNSGTVKQREDRPDLPVIAGLGANENVSEAIRLLTVSEALQDRLRGLRRVGDRRWDVVLDRRQSIKLPSSNPVTSLERLLALDAAQQILDRDILSVDMRDPARVSIRLAQPKEILDASTQ